MEKSCGVDGVFFEDLKKMFPDYGHVFTNILNIMLINQGISTSWKRSVIQRIPKKNFTEEDLSALRDISLLPTFYKIVSKALCKRIIPYIFQTLYRFGKKLFSESGTGKNSYSD